ncbi:hypothetical protein SASPL_120662 [Salvia splendens]|uniref:Uncharacterized protein n=1 Tax=Salvia splendens TaxID=180675 RepID=A0A8X8XV07_SALSN|nr:hypothetical protein SASPL_120662 [Salvia splendens]
MCKCMLKGNINVQRSDEVQGLCGSSHGAIYSTLTIYADALAKTNTTIQCHGGSVGSNDLLGLARYQAIGCKEGFSEWFVKDADNPNVIDKYTDSRDNYPQAEPSTSPNAPIVGVLARLAS